MASRIARRMVCLLGMNDEFGLLATPELFKYAEAVSSPICQRVSEAAGQILKREMENTIKLLEENRAHLDAVSKLLVKDRLYRNDLQVLLPPCSRYAARSECGHAEFDCGRVSKV